jgi:uncharacterized membrane protein
MGRVAWFLAHPYECCVCDQILRCVWRWAITDIYISIYIHFYTNSPYVCVDLIRFSAVRGFITHRYTSIYIHIHTNSPCIFVC